MSSNNAALGVVLAALCFPAAAVEDLSALEVVGQRGQSLEQTRRDRYECHNWSVEQTGESPPAVPADAQRSDDQRELRQRRIDRAIVGAAVGGAVGGLLGSGRGHDTTEHAIVGAAAGAAVGAASAGSQRKKVAAAEEPSDYLRALTACLEGRGYSVALPTAELTARR